MADSVYLKLREFLDQFPLGYPATGSGVEIRILERLFTEDEAQIAIQLSPLPEEASQIASRIGVDEARLEKAKGLVFRVRREGKTYYNAVPFMIGLYEYSVNKVDKELAALFKEYYEAAYCDEMGASNVPGFKVIPVLDEVSAEVALFPSAMIREEIKAARKIAVAECLCRKEARLTGDACDHSLEACLTFGAAAEYYIDNKMGREISADEAVEILERTDEEGLVHAGVNTKHLSNICNCCPCCCASLKGITKKGHDKKKYMNALFEAVIDEDECALCADCEERCPVGAITLSEKTAKVDRDRCLGCGLCAGVCESGAIAIRPREDAEEPFNRVVELGMAIMEGKKKRA
jgi:Pyruvate/2-oxoacid:ferredoxin oxidoreductase delta subunit